MLPGNQPTTDGYLLTYLLTFSERLENFSLFWEHYLLMLFSFLSANVLITLFYWVGYS